MMPGRTQRPPIESSEARLAWLFVAPALVTIVAIAFLPLAGTFWESLHHHDLRMPWLGRPFVFLAHYTAAFRDPRFIASLAHAAFFTIASVAVELAAGLVLALALNAAYRGRGLVRVAVLLPWAIPTVVVALLWRFMFESEAGVVNAVLGAVGLMDPGRPFVWLIHSSAAWVPVILADAWKMTPFVALLLLAGLQNIDPALYEAASLDGASPWRQLVEITLPLLEPAIVVAVIFRMLDAFRVFDLIYVLTGGGPGTSTEPISLYAFNALLQNLRFGYGSALSMIVFLITFVLAAVYIRLLGASLTGGRDR
jgi:ABC-type sugar transport system permease subunit